MFWWVEVGTTQNRTSPAEAGAQLGTVTTEGGVPLLPPFQLGPGLRRGGGTYRKGVSAR